MSQMDSATLSHYGLFSKGAFFFFLDFVSSAKSDYPGLFCITNYIPYAHTHTHVLSLSLSFNNNINNNKEDF